MKQYFVVIIMHLKIFINCFRGMEQHPLSPIGLDFLFQGYMYIPLWSSINKQKLFPSARAWYVFMGMEF